MSPEYDCVGVTIGSRIVQPKGVGGQAINGVTKTNIITRQILLFRFISFTPKNVVQIAISIYLAPSDRQVWLSTPSDVNSTRPSANKTFTPPECMLVAV